MKTIEDIMQRCREVSRGLYGENVIHSRQIYILARVLFDYINQKDSEEKQTTCE